MKKGKFIAGITALSVMMMSSGYALWTQQFKSTNTVATGHMDIVTTAGTISEKTYNYATETVVNATTGDTNAITATIGNAYPGAEFTYTINVKNTGTMPVKLDEPIPALNGLPDLADSSWFHVDYEVHVGNQNSVDYVIEPDATAELTFNIKFDKDAPNALENKTVTLTNDIKYVQWNK